MTTIASKFSVAANYDPELIREIGASPVDEM